jgi:two-component system, NtrC family, sensor histidine kinase HydH
VLFSLLLVLAPAVVFEVIAISNGRRTLIEAVGRQLTEEARGAADSLSGTLNAEFGNLRTFARQDLMREIRIGDIDKRISTFLASLQHGEQSILELHVTNLDGAVVAATNPARIGNQDSPSAEPASSAPTLELLHGPAASPVGHGLALRISVPIPDPDRNAAPVGRLTALYDWEHETRGADQIRRNLLEMGLDVDVIITDKSGVVIGGAMHEHSPTPVGTDLRAAGWTATDEARYPAPAGCVVDRGARALVGYARLRDGAPAWSVLVAQPLSKAFEPVRAMTMRLGIALAMVLAAALGLAMLLANRIARPLRDLTDATKEIASGEGAVPAVSTRSRDEVGQLAAAFNQMSIDLRRAQKEVLEVAKCAFVGERAAGVAH